MGFRFKKYVYIGGTSPWSGGTGTADQALRSQAVCKDFADFIIACGKGWQLDTNRNATTSSFVSVPMQDYDGTIQSFSAPGLFFTNSISGCKLFLCVAGFSSRYGIAIDKEYCLQDVPVSTRINYTGIIMSIIPEGSQNTFGSSFNSSFLPSDATPIIGTMYWINPSSSSKLCCYIAENASSQKYCYGIFVDSFCLGISGGFGGGANRVFPGYFVGRVIGSLAQKSDTLPQSKYGIIKLGDSYNAPSSSSSASEFLYMCGSNFTSGNVSTATRFGAQFYESITNSTTTSNIKKCCCGGIFSSAGQWIDGRNGANVRYFSHTRDFVSSNSKIRDNTTADNNRWTCFESGVVTDNLSLYGVVPGDGFKGLLDTELFRSSSATHNQLYTNGSYIGFGALGDSDTILLAWDSTNTDMLS